ncbi:SDR family oxidoreductase [Chitinophaga silvisoli]|uniref:SDR family NAD(P)-dependent oxidoreductase n=1 Tax=Chitinophaga silvisoli TaxID=2291814 RepID=A0A3E1NYD4_9BACT|nr:SDR family oxidoreductase [Chitinophaga silvisoli]RFM32922.1 SDR family NAD(P)-dependent oxidoreductase [Chitinophaga silvisoli]
MNKTVLITGTSSGFGRETAKLFQQKGWNVAATMRSPEKESELQQLDGIRLYRLDVTDAESIKQAVAAILQDFKNIDVLVNNAGFAVIGALEAASKEAIHREFDTNVLGVIDMIREVLPSMRAQRSGVIVNVTSTAGIVGVPYGSLYNASKFAVEGLTESLQYELEVVGIRCKLIEPTGYKTNFGGSSMLIAGVGDIEEYRKTFNTFISNTDGHYSENVHEVAEMIFTAATDNQEQLRYPVGNRAGEYFQAKQQLGDVAFKQMIKQNLGL